MNAPLVAAPAGALQGMPAVLDTLPAMVDRARATLMAARSAAEVLEARSTATLAYDMARGSARFGRAIAAHGELVSTAWRVQADALLIESQAKIRLADEYDAAQERGEVQKPGNGRMGNVLDQNISPATVRDLGLTRNDVFEARRIRDAVAAEPGLIERTVAERLAAAREPTRAAVREAVAGALSFASQAEFDAHAKRRRAEKQAEKAERRAAREERLGERTRAASVGLGTRRYNVILADPEWEHKTWSADTGMDRAAANHYPTSPLAAICARDVASIAADDCVLALWTTVPHLAEAFCVLDAWGFARFDRDPETGHLTIDKSLARYVSSACWVKHTPGSGLGMGYWFRVDHEVLLIATRGTPPAPAMGTQARSVFDVPASRIHSEKPELVCEILESYFPNLPKIELNRRGPARPGWDAWGNEAEEAAA